MVFVESFFMDLKEGRGRVLPDLAEQRYGMEDTYGKQVCVGEEGFAHRAPDTIVIYLHPAANASPPRCIGEADVALRGWGRRGLHSVRLVGVGSSNTSSGT